MSFSTTLSVLTVLTVLQMVGATYYWYYDNSYNNGYNYDNSYYKGYNYDNSYNNGYSQYGSPYYYYYYNNGYLQYRYPYYNSYSNNNNNNVQPASMYSGKCLNTVPPTWCDIETCRQPQTKNQCCLYYFYIQNDPCLYVSCMCVAGTMCYGSTAPATTMSPVVTAAPTKIALNPTTPPATTGAPTKIALNPTTTMALQTAPPTTPPATTASPTTPPATTGAPTTPPATTGAPTTTASTQAPAITPTLKKFCAAGQFRLINSQTTDECDFKGISNITRNGGETMIANAVFAPVTTPSGNKTLAFVTHKIIIEMFLKAPVMEVFEIQIGPSVVLVSNKTFTFFIDSKGAGVMVPNKRYMNAFVNLLCQREACSFDGSPEMLQQIDVTNCTIVSWGAADPITLASALRKRKVDVELFGCPITKTSANALCVKASDSKTMLCGNDVGAPCYCYMPSEGADVLVGVAERTICNLDSYANIVPIP